MQKVVKVVKAEQKGWKRGIQSHLEPKDPNLTSSVCLPKPFLGSTQPPAGSFKELNPTCSEKHPGLRQSRVGKGTELTIGAVKMHFRQLSPHPVVLPEAEFSAQTKSCSGSELSEDPGVVWAQQDRKESAQKMERKENPAVFQSSSVCVQEHNEELTCPTMPQRGEKLARVSRKIPKISPEKQQPGGSWKCCSSQLGMDGMWLQCHLPSSSQLEVMESGMTLGWRQSAFRAGQAAQQLLQSPWCQRKWEEQMKMTTSVWAKPSCGWFLLGWVLFGLFFFPWKSLCWGNFSLGLTNFGFSVRSETHFSQGSTIMAREPPAQQ